MKMKIGFLVAINLALCGLLLWVLYPRENAAKIVVGSGDGQTIDASTKTVDLNEKQNQKLALEPVKKGLRQVGQKGVLADETMPEMIARLPALEPPPPPEQPKPDIAPKPGLVIDIPRPIIRSANRITGAGYDVTLVGVATVKPGTECSKDSKPWPCGNMARTALRQFVRGRTLNCILETGEDAEKVLAKCSIRGRDLGRWLVSQGWAISTSNTVTGYQKRAKLKQRGLWANGNDAMISATEE